MTWRPASNISMIKCFYQSIGVDDRISCDVDNDYSLLHLVEEFSNDERLRFWRQRTSHSHNVTLAYKLIQILYSIDRSDLPEDTAVILSYWLAIARLRSNIKRSRYETRSAFSAPPVGCDKASEHEVQ